jgi:phosphoribosylglycinamide formyltransferase-1
VVARLVVLISGGGSNLKALLHSLPDSGIPAEVVAVGADSEAAGLSHAREQSLPTFVVPTQDFSSREEWGEALITEIDQWKPDWIVLSGFMKLLPPVVVSHFSHMLVNTHPSFLPEFPGAHAVRDALAAGVSETGASVILVDEGVDSGPILAQERVPIMPGDSEDTVHERIKVVERRLLQDVLESLVTPLEPAAEGREHE